MKMNLYLLYEWFGTTCFDTQAHGTVTQKWPPTKDTTTDTHGLEWNLLVYF